MAEERSIEEHSDDEINMVLNGNITDFLLDHEPEDVLDDNADKNFARLHKESTLEANTYQETGDKETSVNNTSIPKSHNDDIELVCIYAADRVSKLCHAMNVASLKDTSAEKLQPKETTIKSRDNFKTKINNDTSSALQKLTKPFFIRSFPSAPFPNRPNWNKNSFSFPEFSKHTEYIRTDPYQPSTGELNEIQIIEEVAKSTRRQNICNEVKNNSGCRRNASSTLSKFGTISKHVKYIRTDTLKPPRGELNEIQIIKEVDKSPLKQKISVTKISNEVKNNFGCRRKSNSTLSKFSTLNSTKHQKSASFIPSESEESNMIETSSIDSSSSSSRYLERSSSGFTSIVSKTAREITRQERTKSEMFKKNLEIIRRHLSKNERKKQKYGLTRKSRNVSHEQSQSPLSQNEVTFILKDIHELTRQTRHLSDKKENMLRSKEQTRVVKM